MRRSVAAKVPSVILEPDSAVALRVREISETLVPGDRVAGSVGVDDFTGLEGFSG